MSAPVIGITVTRLQHDNRRFDGMAVEYAQAVTRAGGLPFLISPVLMENGDDSRVHQVMGMLDGLLISGGEDVHPEFYGEHMTEQIQRVNRLRDRLELLLAQLAYKQNLPVLGICRGHQLINVALGGTLMHDIHFEAGSQALYHDRSDERNALIHSVEFVEKSGFEPIFGSRSLEVNSIHHQAVRQLAACLVPAAYAPDGILEAFEVPDARFFKGVQWHPEAILECAPIMHQLFQAFVKVSSKG